MTMHRRSFVRFSLLGAAALAAPALAPAQDKPPVRILVGFPPGGSADIVARLLADKMRVTLGQNVLVDNKPGAAGRVALGDVKRAAPDGQTLVLAPSGALVVSPWLYKNLGFDPVRDFTPVARAVTFDFAITAGPGAPSGDLKAVLAWMKANPGKANYGTPGAGTVPHFTGVLLSQSAGIELTHVAYKGGAPAVQRPARRPGAADGRHAAGDHRAPPRRQAAHPGRHRRDAQQVAARRADAEGARHQHVGRRVLRPLRSARHGARRSRRDRAARWPMRSSSPTWPNASARWAWCRPMAPATSSPPRRRRTYKRWEAPIKASGFTAE